MPDDPVEQPTRVDQPALGERPDPGAHHWQPRWSTVLWLAVAGLVLAGVAVTGDAAGAVLAGAAALGAWAIAGYDALVRPTLTADPDGLTVRTGWRPRRYGWTELDRVQVTTTRRLFVHHALEIDAGEDLVLLGRRRLGTDLAAVARTLAAYGAPVRAPRPAPGPSGPPTRSGEDPVRDDPVR